jgi:hypothetical protein
MWATWAKQLLQSVCAWQVRHHFQAKTQTKLTGEQCQILGALVQGAQLKSHRTLDGDKTYCLHNSDGSILAQVTPASVQSLRDAGLITGNMKFPAATYLLTESGLRVATRHSPTPPLQPLTPR